MPKIEIPTGTKFGKWTVTGPAESRNGTRWFVVCTCGRQRAISGRNLRQGKSSSCEHCAQITHGMTKSSTYRIWLNMKIRCSDPTSVGWKDYGGRGIKVCKRWFEFENFLQDMGPRPKGMQLDRRKNHLGYSKANCRWVTPKTNARNKRNNRIVTFKGVSMSVAEAAERSGILSVTLLGRLNKNDGLDIFRAIDTTRKKKES